MRPRRGSTFAARPRPAYVRRGMSAAALALAVLAGGCGASGGAQTSPPSGHRLTVYASAPLSGPGRAQALDLVRGERLALAEAGGRVGRFSVRLRVLDDAAGGERWTPAGVAANARLAVQDETTAAYLGESDTGGSAISLALLNEQGIPQVSPTDTFAGLTEPEGFVPGEPQKYYPRGDRTFVRIAPDDNAQARALLSWMSRLGVRRLLILRDNSLAGGSLGDEVGQNAADSDLTVAGKITVDVAATDFTNLTTQAQAAAPDGVLFAGTGVAYATRLWRALHAAVPHARLFAPGALALPAFLSHLGGAERASYLTSIALPSERLGPSAVRFAQRFTAHFHRAPGASAPYGYEAMNVTLEALRRAGKHARDHRAVIEELAQIERADSPLGAYSLERSGASTLTAYGGYRVRRGRPSFRLLLDAPPGG